MKNILAFTDTVDDKMCVDVHTYTLSDINGKKESMFLKKDKCLHKVPSPVLVTFPSGDAVYTKQGQKWSPRPVYCIFNTLLEFMIPKIGHFSTQLK